MVGNAFPFQPKPVGYQLTNQGPEDCICRYLVEHMQIYKEAKIPMDGITYLHSELSNISAKGMSWLLPNLLRKAVLCTDRFSTITDTFIYDLEYINEGDESAMDRYSWLSHEQLVCFECVLELMSEEHGHVISSATQALEKLSA